MSAPRIGFGASKITPGLGAYMTGYFHERQATAIHDDLFAKACSLTKPYVDHMVVEGIEKIRLHINLTRRSSWQERSHLQFCSW
jgi:hypothetical protein